MPGSVQASRGSVDLTPDLIYNLDSNPARRTTPYPYQARVLAEALADLVRTGHHGLFLDMGTGKTLVTLYAYIQLLRAGMADHAVIVAPKMLLGSWEDEVAKHVAPGTFRVTRWKSSGGKAYAAELAGFSADPGRVFLVNVEAFQGKNGAIDQFLGNLLATRRVLVACDECFSQDTIVEVFNIDDQPKNIYIKDVKKGDRIKNCTGFDTVENIFKREVYAVVELQFNGKKISCSKNHLFHTMYGWKRAADLRPGDRLTETETSMCLVWEDIYSIPRALSKILREELLSEMETTDTGAQSKNIYKENGSKNKHWYKKILSKWMSRSTQGNRTNKKIKSNEKHGNEEKGFRHPEGDGTQTKDSRRKWYWINITSKKITCFIGELLETGIRDFSREKTARVSDELQAGSCEQKNKNRYRMRWLFSRIEERKRFKERRKAQFFGVESVKILEQGNNELDKYRDESGRIYFYDLEIKRHPSFSVNGVLVHNSSKIKTPSAQRTKRLVRLAEAARYRLILTGTEITNSCLDLYAQFLFLERKFWMPLETFYSFRYRYAVLETKYGPGGRTFQAVVGFQRQEELLAKIAPHVSRIKKEDVLDLPPKRYQDVWLDMPAALRKLYDELKAELSAEYEGKVLTVANAAVLFGRFRQISGGYWPGHGPDEATGVSLDVNAKLQYLVEELEDTSEKVLVWACFREEIRTLLRHLPGSAAISGAEDQATRDENVRRFREDPAVRVLVASPAVAAYGLNLQHCRLVYWYSNPLSPEQRWQGEDRCHRIGQEGSVLYKDLLYRDSVDVRVKQLLAAKTDARQFFRDGMTVTELLEGV